LRRASRLARAFPVLTALSVPTLSTSARAASPYVAPLPGPTGWADAGLAPLRGVTIGPIENARHPGRGYGSMPYLRAIDEAHRMGATWVSLTPFGRVASLSPSGVEMSFEAPFAQNRADVLRAIEQAHGAGLRVLLVPHIWVETYAWRALIDPGDDAGWARYAASYACFASEWARVAEEGGADMFSIGVEQRSWVTSARAPLYQGVLRSVRAVYHGPLTYSANWDDVDDTVILGELDVIGINAFYPLAEREGARLPALLEGGRRVAEKVRALAARWGKPILFTEIGYKTVPDPAVKPWIWPEDIKDVKLDELAQAEAYAGLLAPLVDEPSFLGFFVWRLYADPDDTSQEPEFGFSPRGKRAELVMRDAFTTQWASDPWRVPGALPTRSAATEAGVYDGPVRGPWLGAR
jgi:hypothetical protein